MILNYDITFDDMFSNFHNDRFVIILDVALLQLHADILRQGGRVNRLTG